MIFSAFTEVMDETRRHMAFLSNTDLNLELVLLGENSCYYFVGCICFKFSEAFQGSILQKISGSGPRPLKLVTLSKLERLSVIFQVYNLNRRR
jgi:hypothetical protein